MKKLIPMALGFITATALTVGSFSVFALDQSVTASSTTGSSSDTQTKEFQEKKTRILKHINDRLTKMQEIQSCVQAANDFNALHACKKLKGKSHKHSS